MTAWVMDALGRRPGRGRPAARATTGSATARRSPGLMAEHGVDPGPYLHARARDRPRRASTPDPRSPPRIAALPGRRIVYTNGSAPYAARVLAARGLGGALRRGLRGRARGLPPQARTRRPSRRSSPLDGARAARGRDVRGRPAQPRRPARDGDAHGPRRPGRHGRRRTSTTTRPTSPPSWTSLRTPLASPACSDAARGAMGRRAGATSSSPAAASPAFRRGRAPGRDAAGASASPTRRRRAAAAEADGSDLRSTAFLQPARALLERAGLWESPRAPRDAARGAAGRRHRRLAAGRARRGGPSAPPTSAPSASAGTCPTG